MVRKYKIGDHVIFNESYFHKKRLDPPYNEGIIIDIIEVDGLDDLYYSVRTLNIENGNGIKYAKLPIKSEHIDIDIQYYREERLNKLLK